ncbi:MAG: betaine-aldehyde dehydrogenase, partial [Arsenicicoccus sp.]
MSHLFIDGTWRDASDGGTRTILCPADQSEVGTVSEATAQDAEAAVLAARRAFDEGGWPQTPAPERAALLRRVADRLAAERDEVARLESLDTGKRFVESQIDVDDIEAVFRHFADLAASEGGRVVDTGQPQVASKVVHEPVGVCSLITPWNYPLLQTSWKVAPALAAGNTFVLKPSELTPHTSIWLMHALTDAGLPAGVANLVLGAGATVGPSLTTHEAVDLV